MTGYRLQLPGPVPTTSSQWVWCGNAERQGTSVCATLADLLGYLWSRSPSVEGRVIVRCEGERAAEDDVDAGTAGAPFLMVVERAEVDTSADAARALRILRAMQVSGLVFTYTDGWRDSLADVEWDVGYLIRDAAIDAARGRWDLPSLRNLNRARRILAGKGE